MDRVPTIVRLETSQRLNEIPKAGIRMSLIPRKAKSAGRGEKDHGVLQSAMLDWHPVYHCPACLGFRFSKLEPVDHFYARE